ncbi:MAG TPA: HAD family hydrolase [Ktedonobacterales bacterium]
MIHAVFFDLDDTLCDSATAFALGRRYAFELAMEAASLTEQALDDAWDRAHADLLPQLTAGALTMAQVRDMRFQRTLEYAGVSDPALAERMDEALGATQLGLLRLFPDADALGALRSAGVYSGIITNGAADDHADSQRSKIEALGLLHEVDSYWISDAMGHRKPDPQAFAPAVAAAGCPANECLFVGDSLAIDIAGANAAGMRSALLARDEPTPAMLSDEPNPWRVIHSLWELLNALDTD